MAHAERFNADQLAFLERDGRPYLGGAAGAHRHDLGAGVGNVDWRRADPATATLDEFDLLVSNFGLMFFGDPVEAFAHMRRAASPGARMAFVCWRPLSENPWMEVPMRAVSSHVPPRPKADPRAPGMFAFADPGRVSARHGAQPRRGAKANPRPS